MIGGGNSALQEAVLLMEAVERTVEDTPAPPKKTIRLLSSIHFLNSSS